MAGARADIQVILRDMERGILFPGLKGFKILIAKYFLPG